MDVDAELDAAGRSLNQPHVPETQISQATLDYINRNHIPERKW